MLRVLKIFLKSVTVLILILLLSVALLLATGNPISDKTDALLTQISQEPIPEWVRGETGFAKNGDVSIWYETRKPSGPIKGHVVLMMGAAGSAIFWPDFFLDGLTAAGYEVIRYDYRGVGMSDWMLDWSEENAYRLSDMTGDVESILDKLNINRAHVIGTSMGGIIARQFALDHPDRTQSLVLISSLGLVNESKGEMNMDIPVADGLRLVLRYGLRSEEAAQLRFIIGILFMMNHGSTEPLDVKTFAQQILYELRNRRGMNIAALQQHFYAIKTSGDNLDSIVDADLPILVIHGTRDPVIPVQAVQKFVKQLKQGKALWIEGVAHVFPKSKSGPAIAQIVHHMQQAQINAAK